MEFPQGYLQNGFNDSGKVIPKQMDGLAFVSWTAEKMMACIRPSGKIHVRIFDFTENTLI